MQDKNKSQNEHVDNESEKNKTDGINNGTENTQGTDIWIV